MDPIDRQAAIDALERKKDKNAKGDIGVFHNKIIQNDIDALMRLPSVEPKTGKWVDCGTSHHWKCDQCGCRAGFWFDEENSSSWDLNMSEWMSDYCPNCGAKMEGEKNE